jgi:hypothetical protein
MVKTRGYYTRWTVEGEKIVDDQHLVSHIYYEDIYEGVPENHLPG